MNTRKETESKKHKKNFLQQILILYNKKQKFTLITISFIISIIISFILWNQHPKYELLYTELSQEKNNDFIHQLKNLNIPYQIDKKNNYLYIPKNKIKLAKSILSNMDPIENKNIGFELLDQEKFGISQLNEKINYQRALEGELSRTIQSINGIKHARIHLAIPKNTIFLDEKQNSSAAISLTLKKGIQITSEQIASIVHLVSSSIVNLKPENITIIDQNGKLLNRPGNEILEFNNVRLKYLNEIEEYYKKKIESILIPLLGPNNIYAKVTAEINFNNQNKIEEKYQPNYNKNKQSIRLIQKNNNAEVEPTDTNDFNNVNIQKPNKEKINLLEVKKDYKLQDSETEKNINNKIYPGSSFHNENTVHYELNHSTIHTKINLGDIKHISAAVIINYDKNKNGKYVPLKKQKIENITQLVQESIGYSKKRGDSIKVVNSKFFNSIKPKKNIIIQKNKNSYNKNILLESIIFIFFIFSIFYFRKILSLYNKKKNTIKNDTIIKTIKEKNKKEINSNFNINKSKNIKSKDSEIEFTEISKNKPKIIAKIIRKWINEKYES
ncbi:flagellar basal-body MS-ring/collar protein FliF [Buchnera aphidicola (Kurisakia onigurumii)]|uniref:flagellar basal-body MS-ring/collar protein FliF n=1 Tax=Buchnera aphidicola TaxID=9 RepID=UPI0031B73631